METIQIGGSMLEPPKVASIDKSQPMQAESVDPNNPDVVVKLTDFSHLNDEQKLKQFLPHTDWEKVDEATWVTEVVPMTLKATPAEVNMFGDFAWAIHIEDPEQGVGYRPIMGGEMPNVLYALTPGGIHAVRLDTFDDDVTTLKWYWDRDLWKPTLTPGIRSSKWFGEIVNGEMRSREMSKV